MVAVKSDISYLLASPDTEKKNRRAFLPHQKHKNTNMLCEKLKILRLF